MAIMIGPVAIAVLSALLGWSWMLGQAEKSLAQAVTDRQQQLAVLTEMVNRIDSQREALAELTRRIESIQLLAHRRATTLPVLDVFLGSLPNDLWISSVTGRGRELRALGAALSARAVGDLIATLRASGRFADVEIVVARRDPGETPGTPIVFEIVCRLGG